MANDRRDAPRGDRRGGDRRGARGGGHGAPSSRRTPRTATPASEQAQRRGSVPGAQRLRSGTILPRPALPDDERPQLPRDVLREIERALGRGRRADDVALALSIGSAAIDADRLDVALEALAWAKQEASRIASIREAYGVALYLADRYDAALSELQAYRRLSGSNDQNHLIADALRALGRDNDQIAEVAEASIEDRRVPVDRRVEAIIVWASALADRGDVRGGRALLRRFVARSGADVASSRGDDAEHELRLAYLVADLAERDGDLEVARRELTHIADADPDYLDVAERLERLGAG